MCKVRSVTETRMGPLYFYHQHEGGGGHGGQYLWLNHRELTFHRTSSRTAGHSDTHTTVCNQTSTYQHAPCAVLHSPGCPSQKLLLRPPTPRCRSDSGCFPPSAPLSVTTGGLAACLWDSQIQTAATNGNALPKAPTSAAAIGCRGTTAPLIGGVGIPVNEPRGNIVF